MNYREFLASKAIQAQPAGLDEMPWLSDSLAPFQVDVVEFALKTGRAAMFLDTGLGKTRCQIEWARQLPGKTLILAPLAVASQTVREGRDALGVEIHHSRDGSVGEKITIANYERLALFDQTRFDAVVLDESSILKSFMGKTKRALCERFKETRFRLACTATPAPNDYMELGNHSEFLGAMESNEMLTRWFINDTMNMGTYRLKGHAERHFWQWVASWAACVSRPSDLGYDDGAYCLPQLSTKIHRVELRDRAPAPEGMLFDIPTISAATLHREKKLSIRERIGLAAEIVASEPNEAFAVWCETNEESQGLRKAIGDCVEVKGSDSIEAKEDRLQAFSEGRARVIVSKPSICGFGLNWQHCARTIFSSVSFSYEQYYQAIRRFWRFGQKRAVQVDVILSPNEAPVFRTVQEKLAAHERMKSAMRMAVLNRGQSHTTRHDYNPTFKATLPLWIQSAA